MKPSELRIGNWVVSGRRRLRNGIYINSEGIVCYMPECPEEPKGMSFDEYDYDDYREALAAAKQSAVPFEKATRDQYLAKFHLLRAKEVYTVSNEDVFRLFDKHFPKDTIHPFPEGYEVEIIAKPVNVGSNTSEFTRVAVLSPTKAKAKTSTSL